MRLSGLGRAAAAPQLSDAQLIAIGDKITDQAVARGHYKYALTALAGQLVLDDTPAAEGQSAMAALGDVAGATATGATIGSVIPGIGTAVGAVIGALISIGDDIADAIEGPPDPSQNEYRYRSDRACFQAAAAGYPYGVIPGFMRWNPRGGAGAWFYQSTQGPYTAASRAFTFSVTWIALPGSTDTTKGQAWLLCQIFMASDSVTRGNYQPNTTAWGTATAALQAQVGAAKLGRWLALVARWYGAPSSFSPVRPYESTGGNPPDIANTAENVEATIAEFQAHPLDWTYYPIPSFYNQTTKEFEPTDAANETDVMVSADTWLLALCEGAILGWDDETAFHATLFGAFTWATNRRHDVSTYPGIDPGNHRNFSRILGLLATALRPQRRAARVAAGLPVRDVSSGKFVTLARTGETPAAAAARAAPPLTPIVAAPVSHRGRDIGLGLLGVAILAGGVVAYEKRQGRL